MVDTPEDFTERIDRLEKENFILHKQSETVRADEARIMERQESWLNKIKSVESRNKLLEEDLSRMKETLDLIAHLKSENSILKECVDAAFDELKWNLSRTDEDCARRDKSMKRLRHIMDSPKTAFNCTECGYTKVDEDGCCCHCGKDTEIVTL
jgi:chromosome segregation ATPase